MFGQILALAMVVPPAPAAPAGNPYARECEAAAADARRLGPEAAFTRYLTVFNLPEKDIDLWQKAIDYYANSTSRAGRPYKVRRVGTLLAVPALSYGTVWPVAWENFASVDPFFHVQLDLVPGRAGQKMFFPKSAGEKAGWYEINCVKAARVPALAPWTGPAHAELVALTGSATPILRADFFVSQAFIQADRKGTGYYSFLGIKTVADFDKLIGFDRKAAEEREYQVAAIVRRSGVARFPRQVFIEQALTGKRAETRDVTDDNADARNALRQLDGDYKFQALELYGFNTIGLFVYGAANDKGDLQDSVPDKLGHDHTSTDNDGRIHPFLGCVRCHVEGYRAVADWGRANFNKTVKLTSPDPLKLRRLEYLYLGDLDGAVEEANLKYAKALKALTGWKPEEAAKAVGQVWNAYVSKDYAPADVAAEFGLTEAVYLKTLKDYFKANKLGDQVLSSHLNGIPIRSDDLEQLYPLLAPAVLNAPMPEGAVTHIEKATSVKMNP